MSKKTLSVLAAAALATAGLAGCAQKSNDSGGGGSTGSGGEVRVYIGADTNIKDLWEKSVKPGFEKANPGTTLKIDFDLHEEKGTQSLAKLTAAEKGGQDSGWDLMDGGIVLQAAEAGVLEQATKDQVKGLADVPEDTIKAGGKGGIPYRGSSVLLAYNPKTVPTPPKTFDELMAWIKANPGKFTYNSPKSGGSGGAFVTTVLDKYLPADTAKTLRTTYDKNLLSQWKPGWDALRGLNPYVYSKGVYPTGNKGSIELLAGGQIAMTPVWSDMFISGQKAGTIAKEMKATQISDPSFTGGASYLGIPAHAKNKANALKLADYLLSPEAQNMIAKDIAGYPVIPLSKLPQETQDTFKEAHPETLRAGYFDKVNKDRDLAWDQEVPGK